MYMLYTNLAHQEPESINIIAIIRHKQCRCAYQQREQDRYVVLIRICYSCYIHESYIHVCTCIIHSSVHMSDLPCINRTEIDT